VIAPALLTDSLAIAMLSVAAYCASRLILARLTHRRTNYAVDAVHTAMGVAMAGMLTARLASPTPWVVVFAVAAGWFGVRAVRGLVGVRSRSIAVGSHVRHLVTSATMVYMLVALPTVAAASTPTAGSVNPMGTAGGVRFPTLALLLGVLMVGYAVTVTDRISRPSTTTASETATAATILAPRTVACCQVAMNITMGYMLVTLL
jgi:Domain of unknown function (DUF5134)